MMLIAVNALFSLLVSSPTLIRPAQARQLPAIVMQGTFMSKVKELNSMNKMSSVKKNQKPMASPKKLTPKMIEVTETKFKKTYDKKSLELLWGALLQIYGSVELAEKAPQQLHCHQI